MNSSSHGARQRSREAGFALIELLVVLTIVSLVTGLALNLRRQPGFVDAGKVTARLRAAVLDARMSARRTHRPTPVTIVDADALSFVPDIATAIRGAVIYPDGTSNGGAFMQGTREIAHLDWMTARLDRAPR